MNITGHKSIQGVHAYKNVNEQQHINTMKTLIRTIEPLTDLTNIVNQDSSVVLTESTRSYINTNSFSSQGTTNVGQGQITGDFQNQLPIFNNCHFSNVTFNS
ncbi:12853_t:CDS:1 [Cetraspora pellucida]|uniref:12853_t:CDS:1 n=1 Tax=Cetraspora pellucida TaxID=1433469 RepID=A0A9N9J4J5_9GLOM|nr:12853_t:CDS:1 [Cetraspora pellucida]